MGEQRKGKAGKGGGKGRGEEEDGSVLYLLPSPLCVAHSASSAKD